jgi:hypothetical protein
MFSPSYAAQRSGRSAAWHTPPTIAEAPEFNAEHYHGSVGRLLLEFVPDFSVSRWINNEPYIDPAERERYTQVLLMAGLPD